MTGYVITISRDQPDGTRRAGRTQVHVDLSAGQARIKQIIITAGAESGLEVTDLAPDIDLRLLVRAFRNTAPHLTSQGAQAARADENGAEHLGEAGANQRPKGTLMSQDRVTAADGTRSYRKMPAPAEVLAVYNEVGSITALAIHFGVPRHTAQGWAGRLRQQGFHIGRTDSSWSVRTVTGR